MEGWGRSYRSGMHPSLTEGMLTGPVEGATIDGKLVAMPWFTNSSVLFYRTDVLEELGAEVLDTWDGLDGTGR